MRYKKNRNTAILFDNNGEVIGKITFKKGKFSWKIFNAWAYAPTFEDAIDDATSFYLSEYAA